MGTFMGGQVPPGRKSQKTTNSLLRFLWDKGRRVAYGFAGKRCSSPRRVSDKDWANAEALVQGIPELASFLHEGSPLLEVLFRLLLVSESQSTQQNGDGHLLLSDTEASARILARALSKLLEGAAFSAKTEAAGGFLETPIARIEDAEQLVNSIMPHLGGLEASAKDLRFAVDSLKALKENLVESRLWLRHGLPASPDVKAPETNSRRSLYLTFCSLPLRVNGNSVRTHGMLSALSRAGWQPRAVTRPGFPTVTPPAHLRHGLKYLEAEQEWAQPYDFEGITYTNLRPDGASGWQFNRQRQFDFLTEAAVELAIRDKPCLIHGASNHLIGSAAICAAERLGLPSIYEVRGMWELDYSAASSEFADTDEFRQMADLEGQIASRASHVFAISKGIKRMLISRGIPTEKITLLPNGVDPSRFVPGLPDAALQERLGTTGRKVIGFIGSLSHYEGLEILLQAARCLLDRQLNTPFTVLLVGDGPCRSKIQKEAARLKLGRAFHQIPAVPYHSGLEYYRLADILVCPRLPLSICELVTPIKPYEAMAMAKAVVVSDVDALAGIVQDRVTGLLHRKGSPSSLADVIQSALQDPELCQRLGGAAREFVLQHHSWDKIVQKQVIPVYERLSGSAYC